MRATGIRVLLTAFLLGMSVPQDAIACSCPRSGPPCQAVWTADVIFAGTVAAIERVDTGHPRGAILPLLVSFDVQRGFVNAGRRRLQVMTTGSEAMCGYRFERGRTYLVYATKGPDGNLGTGICSRTRPIEDAGEDLQYLAKLPASSPGARVYGRVTEWRREPYEEHAVDFGPVEGLVVNVRGNAFSLDGITDRDGRYDITGVPVGRVTVTLFAPGYDSDYLQREVELTDAGACSPHDFQLVQSGSASGQVLGADGRPAAGVVVDAVATELAGHLPRAYQQPVKTNGDGRFEFDKLPPGSYVFGVNLTKRWNKPPSGRAVFLPGTHQVSEATVIDLRAGERRDLGVMRLPW